MLTPEREAEIRASMKRYLERRDAGEWITYGHDPAVIELLAELDRLREETPKESDAHDG